MISGGIFDIDAARLQELCDQKTSESPTLDFKRELPTREDRGKAEFLKDVCAFANAEGGDLVYGVECAKGVATRLNPIKDEVFDAAARRLGQLLDAGLEPRLNSIEFHEVKSVGDGYAMIVRVPASYNGPHRFTHDGHSRFVIRNGTHTADMTYDQLRGAFDRTATLTQRASQFRRDRLDDIRRHQSWRPLHAGPLCVVHVIPIAAMSDRIQIDVGKLYHDYGDFMFSDWGGASRSTNLDGLIVYPGIPKEGGLPAYTQVFRRGAVEAVRYAGVVENVTRISSTTVSRFVRNAIGKGVVALRKLGVAGPAILATTLLRVRNTEFVINPRILRFSEAAFADREDLLLPEAWLDDLAGFSDVDSVARPMLEVLSQAFGFERCYDYDDKGQWRHG